MKRKILLLVVLVVLLIGVGSALAGDEAITIKPGQTAEVVCDQGAAATLTQLKAGVTVVGVRIQCSPIMAGGK